jgi:Putative adhesin
MYVSLIRAVSAAFILPVMLVGAAGCDIVSSERHKETAEWRKTFTLASGGRVEIGNVNGRIEVEPGTGNTVEIIAEKSARGATPEAAREALKRLEIRDETSEGSIKIETRHQRSGGLFDRRGAEVRYLVRLPAGADARFTTVNGGVHVTGLNGRIEAETTNGGIVARDIGGELRASATNGGIDVELLRVAEGGAKLECVNGGIKLRLPENAKASISADVTNGGISTTGLALEPTESTRRHIEARLNGGGPHIRIQGTNGGIRLGPR